MSHVYCPECGFQNPEVANYCARCGSYLRRDEHGETTLSLGPDELGEEGAHTLDVRGPALVVRAGGGMAGESFSRRHAEIIHEDDSFTIRDLGSLNGTFVNRTRIESVDLAADDEVQVGKYRMTFLLP